MCVCVCTWRVHDVIHRQGRARVMRGDLRSPVRQEEVLVGRLQVQGVLDLQSDSRLNTHTQSYKHTHVRFTPIKQI